MASEFRLTPEADADILLNLPPAGKYWVFLSSARSDYFYKVDSAGVITSATNALTDPMTTIGDTIIRNGANVTARLGIGTAGQVLTVAAGIPSWATPTAGTVTSVAQSFTGGLISVAGSPITSSGTLALTVAGTSGGIPYFSSGTTWATSAALAANSIVIGGGAGVAPSTITTGANVLTALGIAVGSAGAFVTFNGAGGTPSSLTLTNATGLVLTTGVTGVLPTANGGTAVNIATQILTTGAGITNESGAAVSRIRLSANNNIGKILSWATTGLARWAIRVDGNETGANAGGDIALRRYDDAGTFIDNVWSAVRSTGAFTFEKPFYGTSSLTLGTASTTAGQLTLSNATNAFTQTIRGTNPAASITYDLPTTAPTLGQVLSATAPAAGVVTLSWASVAGGAALSGLTLATASNTINNTNYAQEWQWSTLAAGNGLKLSSTSTSAASNTQTLFNIALSGANGTAAQTTYGLQVSNTHTGTTSTNIAGYFVASGGATRNWSLYTSGSATIGTPNASDVTSANGLQVEGSLQLLELASRRRLSIILNGTNEVQYQSINSGLYFVDTGANPIRFGTSNAETARIIGYNINIGNGTTNASAASGVISVTGGSGTNNAGGSLTFETRSTGSALPPNIIFKTGTTLASGTTLQTPATRFTVAELRVTAAVPIKLMGYTVATLPAAPSVGDTAYCSDLLAPTFLAVAVGGGAVVSVVFYNGANWITL